MRWRWLTVAFREYSRHVLRPGFLLFTFGFPVMLLAISIAGGVLAALGQSTPERVGYMDHSGLLQVPPEDDGQTNVTLVRYTGERQARAEVESGELDAYVMIPANYVDSGKLVAYAPDGLSDSARSRLGEALRGALVVRADGPTERLKEPVAGVEEFSAETGQRRSVADQVLSLAVPCLYSILYFTLVLSSSSYLLLALVEEKENRLMEILGTSLRPGALMAGKILGFGMLGITPMFVWGAGIAALTVAAFFLVPQGFDVGLPLWPLALGAFMMIPAYFLVSAVLAAIGAAVTSTQESQQFAGPVSFLTISPLFAMPAVAANPNGALAVAASLFPLTSPVITLQRLLLDGMPAYQVLLSAIILLIAAAVGIWAAARVLRFGMLRYGKRLSVAELWRAVRG